ncbi:hypothetical protein GGH99_005851, partial [Coemansia sp. RSA 1285]
MSDIAMQSPSNTQLENTQPTQATQPIQATQRPPMSAKNSYSGVYATLVPRNPQLKPLLMERDRLIHDGYTIGRLDDCDIA